MVQNRQAAERLYYVLGALFITALITCNLIANKFVSIDLGFKVFIISAGVLPYPITFLITDILSELYGQKRTTQVVLAGLVASIFVLFILWLGAQFPSIEGSLVDDTMYDAVFQNAWRVIAASMLAYLFAQLMDVRVFHFWKKLTKGKKLWIRNNFSTILSQGVDTTMVVIVLFVGSESWSTMGGYIADGWLFKIIFAAFDTIVIYAVMYWARRYFKLSLGEEIRL
jgi:queuosine precursor transporter